MNELRFFVATFAVTWGFWAAAAALPADGPIRALVFLPGTITPALVALWLTYREGSRVAVDALLGRMFLWRVAPGWYVFAGVFIVAVKLTAALAHRAITGAWPPFGDVPLVLMAAGTLISTPVQAGEELGWRGYALPRLTARFGLGPASVILGFVWAAWHLPLFLIAGTDLAGQSFLLSLVTVTAVSVPIAWLYDRTGGSLLLVMFMHAAINNTTGIVPAASSGGGAFTWHASPMGALTAGTLAIVAAVLLVVIARRR